MDQQSVHFAVDWCACVSFKTYTHTHTLRPGTVGASFARIKTKKKHTHTHITNQETGKKIRYTTGTYVRLILFSLRFPKNHLNCFHFPFGGSQIP